MLLKKRQVCHPCSSQAIAATTHTRHLWTRVYTPAQHVSLQAIQGTPRDGISGLVGSRDACREAFKQGLVNDGEVWMDMIRARNLSSHTYNQSTAQMLLDNITQHYFPAFQQLQSKFAGLLA